jgi:hypothetical protein
MAALRVADVPQACGHNTRIMLTCFPTETLQGEAMRYHANKNLKVKDGSEWNSL